MSDIRFIKGDTLLFQGPGHLEELPDGLQIAFESPDFSQTWILGKKRLEIVSRTEMTVRMQLRDGEHCPVHIDSPWGCMETTAVVRRLEIADGQAEAVYELEGDVHRFRLEWTKE